VICAGQPSGASGRARAGRCPRARTGRPRRGAAAVRHNSEGGMVGANRLGRHGRRSPPKEAIARRANGAAARVPDAFVTCGGSAGIGRTRRLPGFNVAERRRAYQFTGLARGTCALRDLPSGTGSRVGTGMGTGAASGRVGGTYPVNPPPMDRHCSAAKHERKPRLARSATGVAPGHVAEEGVC
jgi:hypothetical protein